MPGKSKHSKGKHAHLSKKSRARLRDATGLKHPPVTEATQAEATTSAPPAPVTATAASKTRVNQYPYINSELRRISILAGIILVILVVLAVVLP